MGSLKFVMRPARNDVFSSSDNALWKKKHKLTKISSGEGKSVGKRREKEIRNELNTDNIET